MITREQVFESLKKVIHPGKSIDIVTLVMVEEVTTRFSRRNMNQAPTFRLKIN
jgi:metal-sulfur cluster biosynthetic enzyme